MIFDIQAGDAINQAVRFLTDNWNEVNRSDAHAATQTKAAENISTQDGKTGKGSPSFQSRLNEAQGEGKTKPAVQNTGNDQWIEYTIKPGDSIWKLSRDKFHVPVDTIIRDNGMLNPKTLQIGQKLRIRVGTSGTEYKEPVVASWYGAQYHGKVMSNGKPYDMYKDTIAHRNLPMGSRVRIENPATGTVAEATVTDRGPFIRGRDIDLSYSLAKKLSVVEQGVSKLLMKKI